MVGLLSFSVAACDHSAPHMPAGGCSRAATECIIPAHPRAAIAANLRDHAVRLMKRRGRHGLGGGCDGQSKSNSDEPNHCHLLMRDPSKDDFLEDERAPSCRLRSSKYLLPRLVMRHTGAGRSKVFRQSFRGHLWAITARISLRDGEPKKKPRQTGGLAGASGPFGGTDVMERKTHHRSHLAH